MLDPIERAATVAAILESNECAERGELIPAEEVYRKLREMLGLGERPSEPDTEPEDVR
jgi:predicted transcriptional regulator